MIDSCTLLLSHAVSGVYQLMISRTWSGWLSRSTAARCHWRHVDCWWRHSSLVVYISSTRPTDDWCMLSWRHSTWSTCGTASRRRVARLSSVTAAQHRTSDKRQWVKCLVLLTPHTIIVCPSVQWRVKHYIERMVLLVMSNKNFLDVYINNIVFSNLPCFSNIRWF